MATILRSYANVLLINLSASFQTAVCSKTKTLKIKYVYGSKLAQISYSISRRFFMIMTNVYTVWSDKDIGTRNY